MVMGEHSRGPWGWRPVTLQSMAGWDEVVLVDANGECVATLKPGAIGNPADARLIAAAPQLLSLVERFLDVPTPATFEQARALLTRLGDPGDGRR
jgi:hypothetical protein